MDPLCLEEWPKLLWERSFIYNLPLPEKISPTRGGTIVYLAQSCVRTTDNLSLRAALWLSARLGIPLVALALVDEDLLSDLRLSGTAPSKHTESSSKRSLEMNALLSINRSLLTTQSENRLRRLFLLSESLRKLSIPLIGALYRNERQDNAHSRLSLLRNLFSQGNGLFAVFTDDFMHPLHVHICSQFSRELDIPCLAFESNRLQIQGKNTTESLSESVKLLAESDWEFNVDFEAAERVQGSLQFQNVFIQGKEVFVPKVFTAMNLSPIDWMDVERLLVNVQSNRQSSAASSSENQLLDRFTSEAMILSFVQQSISASILSRTSEDLILSLFISGLLSPIQLSKCLSTQHSSSSQLRDSVFDIEIALSNFRLSPPAPVIKDPSSGLWAVDWFCSLDESVARALLDPDGPICATQLAKKTNIAGSSYDFSFSPKDARTCATGLMAFDVLQRNLFSTAGFIFRRKEIAFWILTYLFALPAPLALEISFQQWAMHAFVPFDDCLHFPAIFMLAIGDLNEMMNRSMPETDSTPTLLGEYESLQTSVKSSLKIN